MNGNRQSGIASPVFKGGGPTLSRKAARRQQQRFNLPNLLERLQPPDQNVPKRLKMELLFWGRRPGQGGGICVRPAETGAHGPDKGKEKEKEKERRTSTARTDSRPQRCIPSSTTGWSPSSTSIASRSGMKSGPSTSSCRYPPVSLACAHVGRNLNERTIGHEAPDFRLLQ